MMRFVCLLLSLLMLSSCVIVKTHKNVEQSLCSHEGYRLEQPLQLYRAGNQYYLAGYPATLQLVYANVQITTHDSNPISYKCKSRTDQLMGLPLPTNTAKVLLRSDGYTTYSIIYDEIRDRMADVCPMPRGAQRCAIRAKVDGDANGSCAFTLDPNAGKADLPLMAQCLGTLDRIFFDWPATAAYNLAAPVIAPISFFYHMLTDE